MLLQIRKLQINHCGTGIKKQQAENCTFSQIRMQNAEINLCGTGNKKQKITKDFLIVHLVVYIYV